MADYIRRILAKAQFTGNFQSEYPTALIHALLDDVPSEDVRPVVRGKWEMEADPYGFFDEIPVCSNCGCTTRYREKYAYCPNCGADMRGGQGQR